MMSTIPGSSFAFNLRPVQLLVLTLLYPASGAFATDVPRGGVTIDVGAGGNLLQYELKNTTGKMATDVTVTVFNGAVPNITGLDNPNQAQGDHVDDNNDGDDGDSGETDQTDATPDTTCRMIFKTYTLPDTVSMTLNITLSGNTPAGTKLKVRFSHEDSGKHWDLCMNGNLFFAPGTDYELPIPVGSHRLNTEAMNGTGMSVTRINLGAPSGNPFTAVTTEAPFQSSVVTNSGSSATIALSPALGIGQTVGIDFVLASLPTTDTTSASVLAPPYSAVPSLNEWGVAIFTLLLLTTGGLWLYLRRRTTRA